MTTVIFILMVLIGLTMAVIFGSAIFGGLILLALIAFTFVFLGSLLSWPVVILLLLIWLVFRKKSCSC